RCISTLSATQSTTQYSGIAPSPPRPPSSPPHRPAYSWCGGSFGSPSKDTSMRIQEWTLTRAGVRPTVSHGSSTQRRGGVGRENRDGPDVRRHGGDVLRDSEG